MQRSNHKTFYLVGQMLTIAIVAVLLHIKEDLKRMKQVYAAFMTIFTTSTKYTFTL